MGSKYPQRRDTTDLLTHPDGGMTELQRQAEIADRGLGGGGGGGVISVIREQLLVELPYTISDGTTVDIAKHTLPQGLYLLVVGYSASDNGGGSIGLTFTSGTDGPLVWWGAQLAPPHDSGVSPDMYTGGTQASPLAPSSSVADTWSLWVGDTEPPFPTADQNVFTISATADGDIELTDVRLAALLVAGRFDDAGSAAEPDAWETQLNADQAIGSGMDSTLTVESSDGFTEPGNLVIGPDDTITAHISYATLGDGSFLGCTFISGDEDTYVFGTVVRQE